MQITEKYKEADGHVAIVLDAGPDPESLKQEVLDVLERVWIGDIIYDEDIAAYTDALSEFGIDLNEELRTRGLDNPFSDKKDRLIKDRGDIGEVLGYLRETLIRKISPDDIFSPLIWAKLKGGVTTHGIDGIGFIWGSGNEPDQMILCEWKHTAQSGSIRNPCSSAAEEWTSLTFRKLLQEMRRVRRIYEDRSDLERASKLKWFAYLWKKRDLSVSCVTMVVYPDIISIDRAREDVSLHLVKKCAGHSTNPICPGIHEGNLLPLPGMDTFLDNCYQEFVCGQQ